MPTTTVQPLRYTVAQAAAALGLHAETVRKLARAGALTDLRPPNKRTRRSPIYLDVGEVAAYAAGGEPAVADYRARHGRRVAGRWVAWGTT